MRGNKKKHYLASVICKKDKDKAFMECFNSSKGYKICSEYDKCIVEEKSNQQIDYVISNIDDNIFLEACPGSGKTEVVGLKAAYEISQWEKTTGGIAILTFTNNAADVIQERVRRFTGVNNALYPHYIGTIDSWLHGYITQPYGWTVKDIADDFDKSLRVVDEKSDDYWLKTYTCKVPYCYSGSKGYGYCGITANKIFVDYSNNDMAFIAPRTFNRKIMLAEEYLDTDAYKAYLNDEIKTKYFKLKPDSLMDLQVEFVSAKNKMFKSGFATYRDMEYIAFKVLKDEDIGKRISKRFPNLIIDECQDLSLTQLKILEKLQEYGVNVHVTGDIYQSIYSFKGVRPEYVLDYVKNQELQEMKLTNNYRSCVEIVELCNEIVPMGHVHPVSDTKLEEPCLVISYTEENILSLHAGFSKYVVGKGLDIDKSAVVARSWEMAHKLSAKNYTDQDSNKSLLLAESIAWWNSEVFQLRQKSVNNIGKLIATTYLKNCKTDSRYHYVPEFIQSKVSWRRFLCEILNGASLLKTLGNMTITWKDWASLARKQMPSIVDNSLTKYVDEEFHKYFLAETFSISALSNRGSTAVKETISMPIKKKMRSG